MICCRPLKDNTFTAFTYLNVIWHEHAVAIEYDGVWVPNVWEYMYFISTVYCAALKLSRMRIRNLYLLRHTFSAHYWVNSILLISLISLIFRYTMTLLVIIYRHLSIVFYLFLVLLYSVLRCITLTHMNLIPFWLCVSLALFLFPTWSYFILHASIPYLYGIPRCHILLQLVYN